MPSRSDAAGLGEIRALPHFVVPPVALSSVCRRVGWRGGRPHWACAHFKAASRSQVLTAGYSVAGKAWPTLFIASSVVLAPAALAASAISAARLRDFSLP